MTWSGTCLQHQQQRQPQQQQHQQQQRQQKQQQRTNMPVNKQEPDFSNC